MSRLWWVRSKRESYSTNNNKNNSKFYDVDDVDDVDDEIDVNDVLLREDFHRNKTIVLSAIHKLHTNYVLTTYKTLLKVFHKWHNMVLHSPNYYGNIPDDEDINHLSDNGDHVSNISDDKLNNSWKRKYFLKEKEINLLKMKLNKRREKKFSEIMQKWLIGMNPKSSLLSAFQNWKFIVTRLKNDRATTVFRLKDQVQEQQRSSEIEEMREAKNAGRKIGSMLLCALFFFRWKLKKHKDDQDMERQKWIEEKKDIRRNLIMLKGTTLKSNERMLESYLVSLQRGENIVKDLRSINEAMTNLHELN